MIRRRTLPLVLFLVSTLALAGCGPAEPTVDIDALADEMRPVVTEIAQLTYTDQVTVNAYFDEPTSWCGNPPRPEDRGQERYYEAIMRNRIHAWGANGYTIETFTDAARDLLVIPGWELEEAPREGDDRDGEQPYWSTALELAPEGGGAFIRVSVHGRPGPVEDGGTLSVAILAMTACVPAASS